MLTINYAKRAKKLVPSLTSFKIEEIMYSDISPDGFKTVIYMWIHYSNTFFPYFGAGGTREKAWKVLVKKVAEDGKNANR